jgi:antitoxin HigA-1
MRDFPPIHPGEVLQEEFLIPLGISQNQLARVMRVPPNRINDIVQKRRGISAETALRLGKALGTTADFWMNLQCKYDLETALEEMGSKVEREVLPIKE